MSFVPLQNHELMFWLRKNFFPILLVLITLFLCGVNYKTGTTLSGWDTLHPEFNFALYFKRIFFGVWQEHQGLGAVASQAHPAELVRMLFLYPLSFILPDTFLRYSYFFATLIAGPLGMYFFLSKILLKKSTTLIRESISFLGSLVYLLNLSTVQHYYVPLEMFATHFATLPWLFLFGTKFIEEGKKKSLLLLALTTVIAAPMAHTPTLFYVYFVLFTMYLGLLAFASKTRLKHVLVALFTILILNSFWLLPNIYFVVNHGKLVAESKIHSQFSERAFLTGKKYGDLKNTAILKNFLFEWGEYDDSSKKFVGLLDEWLDHIKKPHVYLIGYAVFSLVLLGILRAFRKKNIYGLALLPVFALSMFFIANDNFLFNFFNNLLKSKAGIINEALRFPFTKFSIILTFTFSVYFALGLSFLTNLLKRLAPEKILVTVQTVLISLALVWFTFPAFTGHLISPSMKVNIPQEYFEAFKWFEGQDEDSRIAHFPIHTFWGWVYYDWQYEGAGFIWFGLEQPVLDREFDRWDPHNEDFYWEASYALYSKNLPLLEKVLEKYNVKWLWLDNNVFNPSSSKSVYLDEAKTLIKDSKIIHEAKTFGDIEIYSVELPTPDNSFVYKVKGVPTIGPSYLATNADVAYAENGNYITGTREDEAVYYPFRSLFTGRNNKELDFQIEDFGSYYIFKKSVPEKFSNYYLEIPGVNKEGFLKIDEKTLAYYPVSPEAFINGDSIQIGIPKVGGYLSENIDVVSSPNLKDATNCNPASKGYVKNEKINDGGKDYLRIITHDAYNCSVMFYFPNLYNDTGYLISIESRNVAGKSAMFWFENLNARRSDMEAYLPSNKNFTRNYFIQPPMEKDGVGYNLHLDGVSIGKQTSINDLGKVTVDPIPYGYLTGLALKVNNPKTRDVLVLSQSFEKGWLAFTLNGLRPKFLEHVTYNGWANGWIVDDSVDTTKVHIVFWPEGLEFIGFGAVAIWLVIMGFYKNRNRGL